MASKKHEPKETKKDEPTGDLTDQQRNTEADTEQAEPLVDGSGNQVIGGKSVEKSAEKKED